MSGVYDKDSLLVNIRCSKMSTTYSRCLMQVNTGYEEFSINGLVGAAVKAEVLGYDSFHPTADLTGEARRRHCGLWPYRD